MTYEASQKREMDYISQMQTAENKGKIEGRYERDIEIAQKMLAKGISLEEIVEFTKLTIAQINNIKNK